jgi:hypothetical protein
MKLLILGFSPIVDLVPDYLVKFLSGSRLSVRFVLAGTEVLDLLICVYQFGIGLTGEVMNREETQC